MSIASDRARALARRAKVAPLLIQGVTQRRMAEEFGVSVSTINNDVRLIMEEWAEEMRPGDRGSWRIKELKKLDDLELNLRAELSARKEVKDEAGKVVSRPFVYSLDDRLRVTDRILRLMKRRAVMLGLDAPTKQIRLQFALEDILNALPEEFREEVGEYLIGVDAGRGRALPPARTTPPTP